jgi:hypothetical protein
MCPKQFFVCRPIPKTLPLKGAAFEAYVALYKAGLVNDNLMPLLKHESTEEELAMGIEKRSSIVQASAQMNPWIEVARAWSRQVGPNRMKHGIVTINDANNEIISRMEMILPMDIPSVPRISRILGCHYGDDS